jgi:hypothetical protein
MRGLNCNLILVKNTNSSKNQDSLWCWVNYHALFDISLRFFDISYQFMHFFRLCIIICCTATKIPFTYSFSGNCPASVPIPTFMCLVSDLYIPRICPQISCSRIGRSIVGIYKSLTDTWMWKFGLWSPNSFSGNICFEFSVLVLCGVLLYCLFHIIFLRIIFLHYFFSVLYINFTTAFLLLAIPISYPITASSLLAIIKSHFTTAYLLLATLFVTPPPHLRTSNILKSHLIATFLLLATPISHSTPSSSNP